MAQQTPPNFPDILGTITGGLRYNFGFVQAALAVRPRVVRAGRPFEAIILLQNVTDAPIDAQVVLKIPDRDAKRKKGRFVAKTRKLIVGLEAAEVGYVTLPINCLPDTAIGQDYRIGVDIKTRLVDKNTKPKRIRLPEGGGTVEMDMLSNSLRGEIASLQSLAFDVMSQSILGSTVEVPFAVMSGRAGTLATLKAGWTSLWTIKDHLDDRLLLQRYHQTLKAMVLPNIRRKQSYNMLLRQTESAFSKAGFPLRPIEQFLVAKLLTLILEYAAPSEGDAAHGALAAGVYNVLPLLDETRLADETPFTLPHWVSRFLRVVAQDERAARFPMQAIAHFCYYDLVRDAANHAFTMLEVATGENLGTEEERKVYVDQFMEILNPENNLQLDFAHAWMPLVLGGLIIFDRVLLSDEDVGEILQEIRGIVAARNEYRDESTEPIFSIAERLIEQALMKYGYRAK